MSIGRRTVLGGGGAAALGLVLGKVGHAQQAPASTVNDAVLDQLGREFARLYRASKASVVRSEHLQSAAAGFRIMAVAFPDQVLKASARRFDVDAPANHSAHRRQAEEVRRRFGMDIGNEVPTLPGPELRVVMRRLAREGLAPTLLRMAQEFEARAGQLARKELSGSSIHLVQGPNVWCAYLTAAEAARDAMCAAAMFFGPQAQAACAAAVAMYWSYYALCHV